MLKIITPALGARP